MSDRTALRARLSPDLVPVFERAEKLMEEGLFARARALYARLLDFLPEDIDLQQRIYEADERSKESVGPAADSQDEDQTLASLMRDFGIERLNRRDERLSDDFAAFFQISDEALKRTALDVAVALGLGDDWEASLQVIEKMERAGDPRPQVKVWKLRCLVELERYAETIALSATGQWSPEQLVHVNYLVGLSYEALGVRDQAGLRFQSVHRQDPTYRKVAQKLLNY